MIDINIYESQTCKTVSFGRKGENLARRILFDLSALIAEFGAGSFEWVIRRPNESTVYIALNKEQNGSMAILNLTTTETAISGYGGLELRYYVDDVIVKTIVWRTSIAASLGGGDVPDPIEDYIDQMHEIAQEASESADAAGESAIQAAVSATNAAGSASQAAGYAANAAEYAGAAADSATDSAASATAAHTSEVNAANSATAAAGYATNAASSASSAAAAAANAGTSETAAAGSASAASTSAAQAAASATAADQVAQDIAASSAQIQTNKDDITELKNDLEAIDGTINGYEYFNPSLSANSGVGQDWNIEYVQNLPIGTEVEVIFFGYTGTDFTRFMVVGFEADNTATNLATNHTNQKWTYKFKATKNFVKLRFNLRRSQNQQSVSMAYMVKADVGDALGHDIYALYRGVATLDATLTDVQHATPISAVTPTYTKVNNVYILRDSTIRTGTDYYMTSAFLVPQGKSLWFNSQMPNANAYGRITEWTEQGEYVGYVWSPTTDAEVSYMYTPDHDAYVKLCGYGTLAFDAKIISDNEPGMSIVIDAMLANMVNVKEIYPMNGVKWDVMGDSLTNKDSVGQSNKNYVDWIAQSNGIDANNVAVGGRDWWNGFLAEVSNIRATTDIVTIFGSFNEIGSVTSHIGNLSDAPSASGSFCARAKNILNSIYAVKNNVKIGVITPTPWVNINPYDTDSTTQEGIENFIATLKSLCAMYSIPVLDLYHESMMRPWDEAFRNTYYRQTVVDGQTVGDGVHPNALGHKLYLAPKIEAFMRTMIREYSA